MAFISHLHNGDDAKFEFFEIHSDDENVLILLSTYNIRAGDFEKSELILITASAATRKKMSRLSIKFKIVLSIDDRML